MKKGRSGALIDFPLMGAYTDSWYSNLRKMDTYYGEIPSLSLHGRLQFTAQILSLSSLGSFE